MQIGRAAHVLLLVACLPAASAMAQVAGSSGSGAAIGASNYYFGMIGEFAAPGVYTFPTSTPSVSQLVEAAGGLTSHASNNLRIVRNGRANQRVYFLPGLNTPLLQGDLLIADRQGSGRIRMKTIVYGEKPTTPSDIATNSVQIALIDLIERPVVYQLPSDQATLATLLGMLGQSQDLISSIELIQPSAAVLGNNGKTSLDTKLVSSTALVFDRTRVKYKNLPQLPPVIRPQDRTTPQGELASEATPKPFRPAPNLPSKPGLARPLPDNVIIIPERKPRTTSPAESDDRTPSGPLETIPRAVPTIRQTVDETGPRMAVPNLSSPPTITVAPIFSGSNSEAYSSNDRNDNSDHDANVQPVDATDPAEIPQARTAASSATSSVKRPKLIASDANEQSRPLKTEAEPVAEEKTEPSKTANLWLAAITPAKILGVIVSCGVIGLFFVMLIKQRRTQNLSSHHAERLNSPAPLARQLIPPSQTRRQQLDDLINGDVRVIEEVPQFPTKLELFGNPAEQPRLRLDEPQAIERPHFQRRRSTDRTHMRETVAVASQQPVVAKQAQQHVRQEDYDIVIPEKAANPQEEATRERLRGILPKGAAAKRRQNEALSLLDRVLSDMHKEPRK